jgi:hypothetical protein
MPPAPKKVVKKTAITKTVSKATAKPKPVPAAAKKALAKRDGIDMKRAAAGYDRNSRAIDEIRFELKGLKKEARNAGFPSLKRIKKEEAVSKKLDSLAAADMQYKKMGFAGKINYGTKKK